MKHHRLLAGIAISGLIFTIAVIATNHHVPRQTFGIIWPAPVRLRIPTLAIDATIVKTGLLPDGSMDTPASADQVAWFAPGFAPGQNGNAVLTGHLDTIANTPGVFWKIDTLRPGESVFIENASGQTLRFRVVRTQTMDNAAMPADLEKVFGSATGAHVNLITCAGTWQGQKKGYDKRTVVFTEQVQ